MNDTTESAVSQLLTETLGAHSEYETRTLAGVYDVAWSGWYATYLLDHGLPALLPGAGRIGADRLGGILKQLDAGYRREQTESDWPAYYAGRLHALLK